MPETDKLILNKNQIEIIKAVLYFDLFNYPLTIDELYENSAIHVSKHLFINEVNELLTSGLLKKEGNHILNKNSQEEIIAKRKIGNEGAEKIMPTAYEYSRKVGSFPFVEGVLLSGALSKKYYDDKGDIDFFIVTKPNRLWICRTLLIIRYKLLPKQKKRFWCTNYFISSNDLVIPDINVFTSTELAYAIPTVNYPIYKKFIDSNSWYKNSFPNKHEAVNENCIELPDSILKSFFETIFSGVFGKWLDNFLLYITLKHWQNKYPEISKEDFELQFRSRKNVCKRHTKGYQKKILTIWEEKQSAFESEFNVSLKKN